MFWARVIEVPGILEQTEAAHARTSNLYGWMYGDLSGEEEENDEYA
jgi:hypothetical protein